MNTEQKRAIKSTILECRGILEKDIEQVLINLGIYVDEEWIDINNFSEEQKRNRENIEKVIDKLVNGGYQKNDAVREYIKEVVYTYLNRISALRVLEVRGLIDEILLSRSENGDKSFINSRFYEVAREYCKYNMDAGLTYIINLMFQEISEEIKLLFNTDDEYSFITPSNNGVLSIIKLLCTEIDEESWKQDEIIGWIYQYFNDKEKDDVFDRLYNKKQKIKVEDIPAATQLFTPVWIVDWILDNSLGDIWEKIKSGENQEKSVEEIKLLDPCCGSGHFLVKAYDIFYKMYIEEGKYNLDEIPYKILENNIYGIDIDLRAIQLTSLILFIKTKTYLKNNGCDINTRGKLSVNLVCADSILLNGTKLNELEEKHRNNKTILGMIKIIYEEFNDIRLKGSLIKPEEKIFPLFEEFKNRIANYELMKSKKIKKKIIKGQEKFIDDELVSLDEYKSKRDFSKEEKELIDSLTIIYNEAIKANDITRQLFANEAVKSIKLIDIFMKKYEIVVTNPPYMGKRGMNDKLKDFLMSTYSDTFVDLYSAFIERCLNFISSDGYLGMITQQTFMFTSNFITLRENILKNYSISKLCHLGSHAFEEISGEKVNTAMFVLKGDTPTSNTMGEYIKLINYENPIEKKQALYSNDVKRYHVTQESFNTIEGSPISYWVTDNILNIFKQYKTLVDYAVPKQGMATGSNAKYLRYKWEIQKDNYNDWVTYSKIIDNSRYFTYYPTLVYWRNNGEEIKGNPSSAVRGENCFFKEGIMYSLVGTRFRARYFPNNQIFDKTNSCIFPLNINMNYLLALTNSKLFSYLINILNPTNVFQVGDLKRIPIVEPSKEHINEITDKLEKIIQLRKEILQNDELYENFNIKSIYFDKDILVSVRKMIFDELYNNILIMKLSEEIDDIIFNIYNLTEEDIINIEIETEPKYFQNTIDSEHAIISNNDELRKLIQEGKNDLFSISKNLDISIISLFNYCKTYKFISNEILYKKITDYISYYVGVILGNWKVKELDLCNDGIIPIGSTIYLENDLIECIYNCIEYTFGDEGLDSVINDIENSINKSIEEYLLKDFSKDHSTKYQKRPIYWHICSPKKTFNCFVYYHKLDEDTLYKVRSIYLSKMIERYEEDLNYYNEQLIKARIDNDKNREKDFKNKCSDLEEKLEDLNLLDKNILEILPYKPDLERGVLYNIIPLESILAARVSTDKEREEYYKEVKKK